MNEFVQGSDRKKKIVKDTRKGNFNDDQFGSKFELMKKIPKPPAAVTSIR